MKTPELERTLGFWQSTSFVVGALIGTGIFLKLAKMSVILPSVPWLMAVWVIAGLLSFTGALTYAELSTYVSKTGGEFAIIHEAYGKFLAFFCGWSKFSIAVPGTVKIGLPVWILPKSNRPIKSSLTKLFPVGKSYIPP
jgi:APA family basic amino acid/polyamine antiporter